MKQFSVEASGGFRCDAASPFRKTYEYALAAVQKGFGATLLLSIQIFVACTKVEMTHFSMTHFL
jgi:hypothetical protein